jgi:Cys-rich repeat protein
MQCGGATPYCSPANQCVTCLTDGNCQNGQKCDPMTYRCVATCTNDMQCNAPLARCDTATGRCVMCLTDMDCAGRGGATCDTATNRCVAGPRDAGTRG